MSTNAGANCIIFHISSDTRLCYLYLIEILLTSWAKQHTNAETTVDVML